jgi:hypothetical protein
MAAHSWRNAFMDEFRDLRHDNLVRMRAMNLTSDHLELNGRHPALGLVSARQPIATWSAHDLGHILQISRVMARRYKKEVDPWIEYHSVMK